jgi:hypothetical protein
MNNIHYGFIDRVRDTDWRLGANDDLYLPVINKTGNYTDYIPKWESQIGVYFDSMSCVSFSALDCLETIMACQFSNYNLTDTFRDENEYINFSDRYIAKLSGTTRQGNYFTAVGDAIRKFGLVRESQWDFPYKQRTPVFAWEDYYKEVPQELIVEGKDFLNYFDVKYKLIPINQVNIKEQLKYGTLQISYSTSSPIVNGIYQNNIAYHNPNHAVMIYNVRDDGVIEVLDHYERDGHGHIKFAPDFQFGYWALQYYLIPKENNMKKLKDNTLYQLVEGRGGFAIAIDEALFIDDLAKILATWEVRNNGKGKTDTMTLQEWNSFEHYNLKREKIN